MDNAVHETARLIRTGQVQSASMSEADFETEVCSRMSVFVDCSGADFFLDVKSYDDFASMSLQNLSNGKRLIGSFAAFRNEPYDPAQ